MLLAQIMNVQHIYLTGFSLEISLVVKFGPHIFYLYSKVEVKLYLIVFKGDVTHFD